MPTYLIEADGYHAELLEALQNALVPGMDKPKPVWLDSASSHYFTLEDAQRYYCGDFVSDMETCQVRYKEIMEQSGDRPVSSGQLRPWEEIDQTWFCYQLQWIAYGDEHPRLGVRCLSVETAITFRDLVAYCFS